MMGTISDHDSGRIRAVATDIDGTLLSGDGTISQANRRAVASATARGIAVILATGRIPAETVGYYDQLALTTPLVCYHGALVLGGPERRPGHDRPTDDSRLPRLLDAPLPAELLADLAAFVLGEHPDAQLMLGTSTRYVINRLGALADHWDMSGPSCPLVAPLESVLGDRVYKLCYFCPEAEQVADIVGHVERRFGQALSHQQAHAHLAEFLAAGVSKASGVETALAAVGRTWDETLALGDYYNDLGMIRRARLGLAMANAPEAVRRAADAVTADCDRNGLAAAFERYL